MHNAEQAPKAFINIRRVCDIAGFSKATILRKIQRGEFPRPVIRSGNVVRFDLAEVEAWRDQQFRLRDQRDQQPQAA